MGPTLQHTGSLDPINCSGSDWDGRDDPAEPRSLEDLGRFGLSRPLSRYKVLPEGGGVLNYQHLAQPIRQALERARKVGTLSRDAETKEAWASIYPELSEGKPGLFGAVTARAEAQVLRLSVIYAALDGADAIRLPHLMAAMAVWEYAEASARYISGDATGDPAADRVSEALQRGELTRTDINNLFLRHVKSERIDQALNLLLTIGKAYCQRRDTDGKPVEVWRAC